MDDLLLHGLKDIYYAENQIAKSLTLELLPNFHSVQHSIYNTDA